jgi:hypothetical protein
MKISRAQRTAIRTLNRKIQNGEPVTQADIGAVAGITGSRVNEIVNRSKSHEGAPIPIQRATLVRRARRHLQRDGGNLMIGASTNPDLRRWVAARSDNSIIAMGRQDDGSFDRWCRENDLLGDDQVVV